MEHKEWDPNGNTKNPNTNDTNGIQMAYTNPNTIQMGYKLDTNGIKGIHNGVDLPFENNVFYLASSSHLCVIRTNFTIPGYAASGLHLN